MKDKTEIMSPPSGRPKRRSVRQKQNESKSIIEKNNEVNGITPKKKKIKIRLKDPTNPESFVCEIFDSSLDESDNKLEDSDVLDSSLEVKEAPNGLGSEKPKNYFDILMSKESRRSFNVISAVENEKIPEESKSNKVVESEEVINERKTVKKRNEERLLEMQAAKKNLKKEVIESESSSDDETLFSVRSKLKNKKEELLKPNVLVNSMQTKLSTILNSNQDLNENGSALEGTKEILSVEARKKTPNILNYFSKVESNSNEKKPKEKSKMKMKRKLKEIDIFKNMKKPSWEIQLKNPAEEEEDEPEVVVDVEADDEDADVVDVSNKKSNKIDSVKSSKSDNIKLAPLFQKKMKKAIDPEVQKARLEFLHSGLPTAVKKAVENQKNQIEPDAVYFPEISHVQQRDDSSFWTLQNITLPLKETRDYELDNKSQFRFKIEEKNVTDIVDTNLKVENEDDALKRMRYRYKNVDVDRIYCGLKEKHEKFVQKIHEIENVQKPTADDSIEVIDNCDCNVELFNTLWTEKYKPKSSEILGNVPTVRKLGKWLEAWKAFDEEMKRLAKLGVKVKSKAAADNSSDDFITSDEDDYGIRSPANTCLLSGPNGCGKTALVYALANELEFSVLEVNASSKRTGKKLLTDLQEATQSHKVHHEIGSQPLANLFEKSGSKNKKKLKVKKRKKKKEVTEKAQPDQANSSSKISLILIEDADIVFEEHDEGFVPAIVTLVQSSKRPVIFLTSDPSCNHLDKIRTPSCVVLEMDRPGFVSSCALLDMISILEGVHVKKEAIESIIEQNHNDLRKSLLELQFWLRSGQPLTSVPMPSTLGRIWWGCNKFLYNDEIKHKAKPKPSKRKRINDLYDSSDEEVGPLKKLKTNDEDSTATTRPPIAEKEPVTRDPTIHHHSNILDVMCMVDALHSPKDEEPIPDWEYRPNDGLSLNENMESVKSAERDLSKGLVSELIDLSSRIFIKSKNIIGRKLILDNPSWEEISWRKQQEEARMELTYLVPSCSGKEKRNLNLDYLPVIRNICRTEKNRFSSNTKRKNRFYHYLRTLGADPLDENLDISCEVLKFQS